MPIHDEQHWSSWWNSCQKELKPLQEKKSSFIQPLGLLLKSVCATAPSRKLSGGICLQGYIIIGGNTWSDAETHIKIVCIFPFSADVTNKLCGVPSQPLFYLACEPH